ncbi:hypothetical protein ES703_105328 [subsurface metagenome]
MALWPEYSPARSAFGAARGNKFIYVAGHILNIQRKRHNVPAILALVGVDWGVLDLGQILYGIDYDMSVTFARGQIPGVNPFELRQADGRLHFGHAVVPADHVMNVGQFLLQLQQAQTLLDVVAMVTKAPRLPGQLLVVGGHHAAFAAGGKRLVLTEAASRDVTDSAGFLALVGAAKGLGVVFDNKQIMLLRKGRHFVHVADIAIQVHRHNRPGPLVDQLFCRLDADAMVVDIHVGKSRYRPGLNHGKTAGNKSVTGHDNFIAGPNPQSGNRNVQS